MKILISGGSGFVGSALTKQLRADGHDVGHLVRPGTQEAAPGADVSNDVQWDPHEANADMAKLAGTDAVVHLSGAGIADERWTEERKRVIHSSRVDSTRVLVDLLTHLPRKPRVFVCASAVGYYGNRGEELLTESSAYGTDFLGLVSRDWEAEASRAAQAGMRTVMLRFGVILAAHGGALAKMIAPFRYGVGGRLGSGQQWMPWVGFEDAIEVARLAVTDELYKGPVNVVSPNPVRNEEFTRIVARVLHKSAIFPVPAFALRVILGEMADALLLSSQHVEPKRLARAGYKFRQPDLEPALRVMLGGPDKS